MNIPQVLGVYVVAFGLTAALLEIDLEKLAEFEKFKAVQLLFPDASNRLLDGQKWVMLNVGFLTSLKGRASFYLFVGALTVSQCYLCPFVIVGVANLFAAFLVIRLIREEPPPDVSYDNVRHALEGITNKLGH